MATAIGVAEGKNGQPYVRDDVGRRARSRLRSMSNRRLCGLAGVAVSRH
jgi:hypothetical protein